ncbi:hypothetical protein Bca101_053028 [Brassica carinata]
MEDDEGNGDGQFPVRSSARMEKDDADGASLVDVPVTTTTIDEDEATQEWSIPVTNLSEEEAERLATVLVQNEDEEEYWEYELGEKPSKASKKSENDAIGTGGLAAVLVHNEDEEEYWEYELGEKPSKSKNDAIGTGEEDEEELEDRTLEALEQKSH